MRLVARPQEFADAVRTADRSKAVRLQVFRDGVTRFEFVKPGKK